MFSPSFSRHSEKPLKTRSHWPALTSTVCSTDTAEREEDEGEDVRFCCAMNDRVLMTDMNSYLLVTEADYVHIQIPIRATIGKQLRMFLRTKRRCCRTQTHEEQNINS